MPGLVLRVLVAPGQEVQPGQGLVVLEAMKMENELRATVGGRVKGVLVEAGMAVDKGKVLLEFE
jgi:pyruvate carboxylase subunit B